MDNDKNIGEIIAEAREKKGLSQRQLAKLAGINSSGLSKIEAGERDPSAKMLRKISNVIDVNYNELMYKIGLGLEVTPLNYFIKDYYSHLNLEELDTAEINILGNIQNQEKLVNSFKDKLSKKDYTSDSEKEVLIHTIEDNEFQINSSKEIIKLIQSLKVKERNKNAKK